jgi:uncharacterized membrane protein HdeD (DUF308 family)
MMTMKPAAGLESALDMTGQSTLDVEDMLKARHLSPIWLVVFGLLLLVLGAFAMASVVMATIVSVYFVAISMIIAGVAQGVLAFQSRLSWTVAMWALMGMFYALAGVLALNNPLLAAGVLTLFLGVSLVVSGLFRTLLSFSMKAGKVWGWVAISGVITALLGVMVLVQWPVSSLYILGVFLSVDLLFAGSGWLLLGITLMSRGQSARGSAA